MKQISEEDKRILKGNLAMRDNPNSSIVQVAIANTVILEMVNKYCGKEIDEAFKKCFNDDYFNNFVSVEDINLGDSKQFNI
jgi:hypothetical protein